MVGHARGYQEQRALSSGIAVLRQAVQAQGQHWLAQQECDALWQLLSRV